MIELLGTRRARADGAPARPRRPTSLGLVLVALVALGLPGAASAGSSEWRIARDPLGDGLILPWGLWVAGDVTFEAQVPEIGPANGEIDDVSLLLRYEPVARLAFFTELRLEELVQVVEGEGASTGDVEFSFERLYAEALLTPTLALRVGKDLTPFGLWNQIRRAPLTWTVNEPAVTDDVFPIHTTGLSLLQRTTWHGWSLDATAYGPAQDELTFQRTSEEGWLAGTRLAAGRAFGPAFASVGLNAAGFRPFDRSEWKTAVGPDLDVNVGGHQITGELTFRIPASGGRTVQGLYLQDAIPLEPFTPLARDLYAVVRFEEFQPARGGASVGGLVGFFWRPVPNLILRADYLAATRSLENLEPGFHGSVSLLF